MNTHPFDILKLDDGSGLIFTPCPGTKDVDISTSVEQLKAAGALAIITLMTDEEMQRNNAESLPSICEQVGLQWFHFPIEDDSAPGVEFQQAWTAAKGEVEKLLDEKKSVAIHCRGGSGRTGLMAAILMLERGMEIDEVLGLVKSLRPNSLKISSHTDFLFSRYGNNKTKESAS